MKKISVIGGDIRTRILKQKLEAKGYRIETLGLYDNDYADIKSSDAVILPVPTTKDSKTVFTPLTNRNIFLSDIRDAVDREQLILTCNYCFEGKNCIDYGKNDGYALLNAVPTAEGAIKIAMENTPFTLWKSRVLVIGYGRVGKILADRLQKIGCEVTVSARKYTDFCMLNALGFKYINTAELKEKPLGYDIIFNTVDFPVIPDNAFAHSNLRLIIDLSSKGGYNPSATEENGIKSIFAPGLPAKVAPVTAAEILFGTVCEILETEKW